MGKRKSSDESSENEKPPTLPLKNFKDELLDVPFDKKGQLYGTISKLNDSKSELESDVKSEVEDNNTSISTGRTQRVRKKPKRWDNDEVEVDFSGQLQILESKPRVTNKSNVKNKKTSIKEVCFWNLSNFSLNISL